MGAFPVCGSHVATSRLVTCGHCAEQVVVHNLPWTCTWQQLKDAFTDAGVQNVERADVIIDSAGRSRCASTAVPPETAVRVLTPCQYSG